MSGSTGTNEHIQESVGDQSSRETAVRDHFFTGDDKTLPSQHQAPKSVFEWRNYVDTFTMLADNKWILKYKCSAQIH